MSTFIGIGFSSSIQTDQAAQQAAQQALAGLQGRSPQVVLLLCTVHYQPRIALDILSTLFSGAPLIGASTAGIMLSQAVHTRGIAVLCVSSETLSFATAGLNDMRLMNPHQAGMAFAKSCLSDFPENKRQAFCFFVNGYSHHNSPFLKGIQEVMGLLFPLVGAGSSDDFHFKSSYQFHNKDILQNGAVGWLIGGPARIGIGSRHGWRPLGKPRIIDRAEGNLIHSINGKSAFSLYEEYFGDKVEDFRASHFGQMSILYPLGIAIPGNDEYLIRNAIDILDDGSILCQGEVPEGSEVHIMIGNKESCLLSAQKAAEDAWQQMAGEKARLILVFDSMARLKLLGRTAHQEIKHVQDVFGADIPLLGMYSYGQIAPVQKMGNARKPLLQNKSIVVLAIA